MKGLHMAAGEFAYIRAPLSDPTDIKVIGSALNFRRFHRWTTYWEFEFEPFAEMPAEAILQAASERCRTETIYLRYESSADVFYFAHWKDGELLRKFDYGCDIGWDTVEGTVQPWERKLLFNEDYLSEFIETCGSKELGREAAAISKAGQLIPGKRFPEICAKSLYLEIHEAIPFLAMQNSCHASMDKASFMRSSVDG